MIRQWTCHICNFHVTDFKSMTGCSGKRRHHILSKHHARQDEFDKGCTPRLETTPRHLTGVHEPTWQCKYCDHVLMAQPGTMIASQARLRHWKRCHPKKPRSAFLYKRQQHVKTQQLHVAVRNRSTIKLLSAQRTGSHDLKMIRTCVWPWKGNLPDAIIRHQTRTFWYCLTCGQSSGTAGYIAGKHISKTPCKPCAKRGNLKMSLRLWTEREK